MATTSLLLEQRSPLEPDPTVPGSAARHIAALDGIRGLAVLMVILFHSALRSGGSPESAGIVMKVILSGWLGVDVFFVLSGFLITGIILDTKNTKHFFRNFYVRRTLRIFPLYYLVLFVVLTIVPLFMAFDTPDLVKLVDRQIWLWTYMTNVGFVYFRKAWLLTSVVDLSHLWSLAVEEQFYLIWPLIVVITPVKRLPILCVLGVVLALATRLALWWMGQTSGAMYFATPCRVDGLALGSLLAVLVRRDGFAVGRKTVSAFFAAGIGGLLVLGMLRGGLWFSDKATVAFAPSCMNFICAGLVLCAAGGQRRVTRVLENGALRASGRYSYGLYLIHPLIVTPLGILLLDSGRFAAVGIWVIPLFTGAVLAVSFTIAIVLFHGFEKHWLKLKTRFHAVPAQRSR